MPTNKTHQELVKSKFIEKFRNPLRNYYTYGFMSYSDLPGSSNTIDADWKRLNNILRNNQYFTWSTTRKKTSFMTADSQSQLCNPFHKVYRFALYEDSDLKHFFNIILSLSQDYEFAENAYSVEDKSLPALCRITEERYEDFSSLDCFSENISKKQLTCQQLAAFCESDVPFLTEDQKFRKFLKSIEGLDLLETVSEDKRNVKFKLKKLTLRQITDCCSDEYNRFVDALDFFSRYYFLGEFGSYLLARLHNQKDSVFRFKHEYYMQALNDYVLIDLIYAIENSMWCRLTQVNILQNTESKLICFPLQIRISQTNGRQYLACYDPFKHSYYNIRLDQIDQVEFVENICKSSERIDLSSDRIENEIRNAMTALANSWGVSTTKVQDNNAERPVPLHEVKLIIQHSPEIEYYIANRLKHEKRNGKIKVIGDKIHFTIFVTDTTEMRPWVRSLYSRIIDYSGVDDSDFQIVNDLDSFFNSVEEGKISYRPTSFDARWNITSDIDCDVVYQSEATSLFNKYFGVYFMLFGDVLSSLYRECDDSKYCDCITDEKIRNIINQAYAERIDELGSLTRDIIQSDYSFNIESALKRNNFAKKGYKDRNGKWLEKQPKGMSLEPLYHKKYRAISNCAVDLYSDIIPLTKWELRWLRTILDDPKMSLFLTPDTISSLKHIIPQEITPICIRKNGNNAKATSADNIYYFDRYHSESYQIDSHLFRTILSALHNNEALSINYKAGKGTSFEGIYYPIYIEFSKRDDRFRLYVQESKTDRIYMMNCDRIGAAELTGTNFDMHRCQILLKDLFDANQCKVSVEFEDTRNILDRILNEFSPWEKRCECIRKNDEKNEIPAKYKLTIYYHRYDQMDMVVRLMSYGPYIRFIDKEHFICKEILKRVEKQQILLRNREKER